MTRAVRAGREQDEDVLQALSWKCVATGATCSAPQTGPATIQHCARAEQTRVILGLTPNVAFERVNIKHFSSSEKPFKGRIHACDIGKRRDGEAFYNTVPGKNGDVDRKVSNTKQTNLVSR